jgi:hypothetical protein
MKTLKAVSQQDLLFIKDAARKELLELGANVRLDGMKRTLGFDERVALAYFIAVGNLLVKHEVIAPNCVPAPPLLTDDSNTQEDDYAV